MPKGGLPETISRLACLTFGGDGGVKGQALKKRSALVALGDRPVGQPDGGGVAQAHRNGFSAYAHSPGSWGPTWRPRGRRPPGSFWHGAKRSRAAGIPTGSYRYFRSPVPGFCWG